MGTSGHQNKKKGELPAIQAVKSRHEEHLLSMPGVVSVGIGMGPEGSPVIVVGLDRHRPETIREIPEELEGFRIRVEVIGKVRAL
ncbi:MAG: hypothetical protein LUQ60_05865 [Methanomicrobiales archaeon]|nr:hypothetical protein [Methanomicrobiales archaeon]